jgi:hypothetical protein
VRFVWALTLVLVGCPKRQHDPDTLDWVLADADRAWDARAADGLGPVDDALETAWLLGPDDPRVRWRLARLRVADGLVADDGDVARRQYAAARGHADDCVRTAPGVGALIDLGRAAEAFARLDPERATCAAWLGTAWARWRAIVGPAGTLDDDALRAVLTALPDDPGGARLHATALSLESTDPAGASLAYDRAVAADPDDLVRVIDRALFRRRHGLDVELPAVPRHAPPEVRAQLERARGLGRGPLRR